MYPTQSLLDRTDAVYRQLRALRRRFRVGAWITLIVGGLLAVLVGTYFYIGYHEISDFRNPELIVSLVGDMVDQQIPSLRQAAQDQDKNNASTWAEQASKQVVSAIPQLREQIQIVALQKSDEMIAKIDTLGEQQFRRILNENRQTVQDAINQLKNDEEISEGVILALQKAIEKELQIDANNQAAALVTLVSDVNANMGKLVAGQDLTRQQKAERRALMLAKRYHADRLGGITVNDLSGSLPVLNNMVQEMEEKQLRQEQAEAATKASQQLTGAVKDDGDTKPAGKSEEKMAAAEEKPVDKPAEAAKPADKPEEKKAAAAEEEPADKPAETTEPADKPAETTEPTDKPEEKKAAAAEEKPADKPAEAAKPADKPEEKKAAAAVKPADKPAEAAKPADTSKPEETKN
ncbi:MAG: hypothetical protein ACYC6Y_15865 [Thermoguttaceae bacterium]